MPDLRFRGLAKSNNTYDQFLLERAGYKAHRDGDDWVVPANDPALRAGPKDVLRVHPQVKIDEKNFSESAKILTSIIPPEFDEHQPTPPPNVQIAGNLGILTKLDDYTLQLAMAPPNGVQSVLEDKILPFMFENFGATIVTSVTINATYQQFLISFIKICYLVNRFDLKTAIELVQNKEALSGILPSPLDVLAFPDALTRLSPLAFTLPLRRKGCTFHFQAPKGFWVFKHSETEGLFLEFLSALSPTAEQPNLIGLLGLRDLTEENIWIYLSISVRAINRLMKFINNPLSYIDNNGEVDFLKQLQALGAVHLLFADLLAMNFSTKAHNRISYAFNVLDKLANLRKEFGGSALGETRIMTELASEDQGKELENVFNTHFGSTNVYSEKLLDAFQNVVRRCYDGIHGHLKSELDVLGASEATRLQRLASHRNLKHGTFLTAQQFERLFLESKGTVPQEITTLPILLVLALALDPGRFLNFQPSVTT